MSGASCRQPVAVRTSSEGVAGSSPPLTGGGGESGGRTGGALTWFLPAPGFPVLQAEEDCDLD